MNAVKGRKLIRKPADMLYVSDKAISHHDIYAFTFRLSFIGTGSASCAGGLSSFFFLTDEIGRPV